MSTGRADSQVVVCGLRVRPALLGRAPPPLRGREAPGSLPACHSLFAYEPSLEFRAEQRPNRVQRSQQTAASTTIRACEQQQPWCLRVLVLDELVNLLRLDELLPVGCRTLRAVPAPASLSTSLAGQHAHYNRRLTKRCRGDRGAAARAQRVPNAARMTARPVPQGTCTPRKARVSGCSRVVLGQRFLVGPP